MHEGTVPGIVTQATKLQTILDDLGAGRPKTEPEDQPMPIISDTEPFIHDRVAVDVAARGELGRKRYGTKLQAFNGRKPLQDAYEELLDAACYTLQAKTEVDALLAAWCELTENESDEIRDIAPGLGQAFDRLMGLA